MDSNIVMLADDAEGPVIIPDESYAEGPIIISDESDAEGPIIKSGESDTEGLNEEEEGFRSPDFYTYPLDSDSQDVEFIKVRTRDVEGQQSTSAREARVLEQVEPDVVIASCQAVMYSHHDRAATCLGLDWVPFCCQDPYSCTQHHKNSLYKPVEVCSEQTTIMETLMDTRMWSSALYFCCCLTSERSFPSASTALCILNFILNTHNIDLIGSAVSAFQKIVSLHPPCAPGMLQYYTSVLTDTLRNDTPHHLSVNGIVHDIISRLNDMMVKDLQSEEALVTLNSTLEDSLSGEDGLDSPADERAEADEACTTLSHDEKVNRLFIVLEIIVELFEIDLSVFVVKRSFQLRKALIHRSYQPLMVTVLWATSTVQGVGHLNGICRCIIALYAKCFLHKINFKKRNVIGRLLALVAETVRASERNDELLYPYFGERCRALAREVSQSLSGMNQEDLVEVLSDMRPSYLTLYVTNFLLSEAVGYETTPSLDTVVELIPKCFSSGDVNAEKLSLQVRTPSDSKVTERKRTVNKKDTKGSSLLRAKNQDGKSALDVATSPEIRALLESVGREDKFIEGEARWQHTTCSSLVSELLLVMLRSYMETYLTLHIENELKGCKRRGAADAVRMESRGAHHRTLGC